MKQKICSRCKQEKTYKEFYNNKSTKTGRRSECIDCSKKIAKNKYLKSEHIDGGKWYRSQSPLDKSIINMADGIVKRVKRNYIDVENRMGTRADIREYLREHHIDDIQRLLDDGEIPSIDRISDIGENRHYNSENIQVISMRENAKKGSAKRWNYPGKSKVLL